MWLMLGLLKINSPDSGLFAPCLTSETFIELAGTESPSRNPAQTISLLQAAHLYRGISRGIPSWNTDVRSTHTGIDISSSGLAFVIGVGKDWFHVSSAEGLSGKGSS